MNQSNSHVPKNASQHLALRLQAEIKNSWIFATNCEIDEAEDKEWLAAHPEAEQRVRRSSIREMVVMNVPLGTQTIIRRGFDGSTIRTFVDHH